LVTGREPLADVRAAVEQGDWQQALDALAASGPDADSAEGLELRAQGAYGAGDFEGSVSARERLYARFAAEGNETEAAWVAAMIAMYLMMDTGLMAPVRGWVRCAEQHLGGHGEVPAHALIAMVRTYERFMSGDMDRAAEQAASSIELGRRLGVPPAVVIGRVATARIEILRGDVTDGLAQLDEVGIMLMSGQADPLTTGMMYCELICAAQGLALHDRVSEWTDVMERWRHGVAFGGINGRCRVHRAEILKMRGPCDLAEAEALGACEDLRPWMRREFGWPLVELGNIRLRKGDLIGAEEAFTAAHEHAWSPQPGLALLRLAQGDVTAAAALIADAIAHPFDVPSKERPPFGDLRLAPLLDAQAEIACAAGDVKTARTAAASLRSIADSFPSRWLTAGADLAEAKVALLGGDFAAAIDRACAAMAAWADIGAPFETASARMVLGRAHHHTGNTEAAQLEWKAARAAFEAFGATTFAAEADRLVSEAHDGSAPHPDRSTMSATFRRDGDTRTIDFDGRTVRLHDLKGFRYLERLLADPGRPFHVLDLVAVERGSLPVSRVADHDPDLSTAPGNDGYPAIDEEARDAYRRRLREVDEDIEDATRANDLGRLELAQRDRDYLVAELARAVGLGGRVRTEGSSAERARISVTRALRYSLGRLAEHDAQLAAHLERAVRTGVYCEYAPDPMAPMRWDV